MTLDAAQRACFAERGYAVLPGWATPAEVASLRTQCDALLDAFDPSDNPSVFSTTRQKTQHSGDEFFLRSATNVSCFLEADALDASGRLVVDKRLAVNKVGHALHDAPPFASFCRSAKMRALLRLVAGMEAPAPCQSMLILKHARVGGVVVPHQDAAFLRTDPVDTVVGFWVALDEATRANGCLWALPSSHAAGVAARFELSPADRTTRWAGEPPAWDFGADGGPHEGWVPLEAAPGDVVLLHGALVHASERNASGQGRRALSVHYVEASSSWAPTNWLQTGAPFTPLDSE